VTGLVRRKINFHCRTPEYLLQSGSEDTYRGPLHTHFIPSESVLAKLSLASQRQSLYLLRASRTAILLHGRTTLRSAHVGIRSSASCCLAKDQGEASRNAISVNEPAMLELLPPLNQIQDQIRGMNLGRRSAHLTLESRIRTRINTNERPSYNVLSF
jgi:hypothetical protein